MFVLTHLEIRKLKLVRWELKYIEIEKDKNSVNFEKEIMLFPMSGDTELKSGIYILKIMIKNHDSKAELRKQRICGFNIS